MRQESYSKVGRSFLFSVDKAAYFEFLDFKEGRGRSQLKETYNSRKPNRLGAKQSSQPSSDDEVLGESMESLDENDLQKPQ